LKITTDDKIVINLLKQGDLSVLDEVYLLHRDAFLGFGRTFNLSKDDITDVYQDTILIFYENVRSGKIETLDSTIRTYLFGIGKRLSYQLIRKKGQTIEFMPTIEPEVNNIEDLIEQEAQTYQSQELSNALAKLGESCRRLLLLFYYEQLSIKTIMERMNYANENTVKAHKSRCIRSLQDSFHTNL
jgi:RNA polymerase sigma factor (sigma-70 family)